MAWHAGSSTGYQDLLTKLTDFACSKNISVVVLNAAGTGYTAGDILSIPHASAHLVATVEVLTIGGGGSVATYKLRNMGAYAAQVVSAVVSAGGSNYAVNDVLQTQGGTFTNQAKFLVATLSGSAVATVTLFEGGGSYTAFPSNPAATNKVGPAAGTGSGATLTLTTQAIVGTTGIATTGGTGTGATFDLTLTSTGHTAVKNINSESVNGITNEKEVIFQGTSGATNNPYVGFRSFTQTSGVNTRYGWLQFAMDSFNSGLATASQINVGPALTVGTTGVNLLMFNATESFWFKVNGRRIIVVRKAQGGATLTYMSGYSGLMNNFSTEVETPYPMYLSGSSSVSNRAPDDGGSLTVTGLTELYISDTNKPTYFRHPGTGVYTDVFNNGGTTPHTDTLSPLGGTRTGTARDNVVGESDFEIYEDVATSSGSPAGGAPTLVLFPALGTNETLLFPCVVKSAPGADNDVDTTPRGELDGVFWISAIKSDGSQMTPEDTITDAGGQRYRIFPNAGRSQPYSFFALSES